MKNLKTRSNNSITVFELGFFSSKLYAYYERFLIIKK